MKKDESAKVLIVSGVSTESQIRPSCCAFKVAIQIESEGAEIHCVRVVNPQCAFVDFLSNNCATRLWIRNPVSKGKYDTDKYQVYLEPIVSLWFSKSRKSAAWMFVFEMYPLIESVVVSTLNPHEKRWVDLPELGA
jgi:hypothetical protein